MKQLILLGATAIVLSGCAATYSYVPPAGAPTAVLKLGVDKIPFVGISETGQCPKKMMDQTQPSTLIPAGRRILVEPGFSSLGLAYGMECISPMSFIPSAGKEYFVVYQISGQRCHGQILTKDARGAIQPEPTVIREKFERCMW